MRRDRAWPFAWAFAVSAPGQAEESLPLFQSFLVAFRLSSQQADYYQVKPFHLLMPETLVHWVWPEFPLAGNVALILSINPAFVAIFGALLGYERVRGHTWVGVAVSLAGVALVILGTGEGLAGRRDGAELLQDRYRI